MSPENEKKNTKYNLPSEKTLSQIFSPVFRQPKIVGLFFRKKFRSTLALRWYTTNFYRYLSQRCGRLNRKFLEDFSNFAQKTDKKLNKTHSEKSRSVLAKIKTNQFLLFHRSTGIGTLFSQHEPWKKKKKVPLALWKTFFSHFISPIFRQQKFFGSRKIYGTVK